MYNNFVNKWLKFVSEMQFIKGTLNIRDLQYSFAILVQMQTPHSGYVATIIPWDIVLCNVVEYKWNTDTCDSYLY